MQKVNELLREKRIEQNMTLKAVAEKAGIALRQYQRYESGERDLLAASFVVTCNVLEVLEIDIKDFFHSYNDKAEYEVGISEKNEKPISALLDKHKKVAILTKARNNRDRNRQVELIKEKCSDLEIVKEYHATYTNIEKQYNQILIDAQNGIFDLLITTYARKFAISEEDDDAMRRVHKLAETGVACYFSVDSFYYSVKSDGTIVKGII